MVRGHGGDFAVGAHINGARVPMVLDTGASSVVLTQQAAKAAGLPLEVLNYTVNVDTANGRTRAAPVTLDRLAVGGLIERSVPALVAQPGQLKNNLLGMSFLNRLESWEVRGDSCACAAIRERGQIRLTIKRSDTKNRKTAEGDFELAPRQPVRQPHAIACRVARYRRHQHEADQRHEADRQRRHLRHDAASRPACSRWCRRS